MSVILNIKSIEWISVKDALPDADTIALVYAPGTVDPVWLGYNDALRAKFAGAARMR